jgi:hypothetical protein
MAKKSTTIREAQKKQVTKQRFEDNKAVCPETSNQT